MKSTPPEKQKRIKKWWCSNCGKKAAVRIVFGYPIGEAVEAHDRGEIWLGGCCLPTDNWHWPLTHCLACEHEDIVKYETKKSLSIPPKKQGDLLIEEDENGSFIIHPACKP
jgi:hypothetical protein